MRFDINDVDSDPRERDAALVARDVLQGKVSFEAAREVYAVAVTADGQVDLPATTALRKGA